VAASKDTPDSQDLLGDTTSIHLRAQSLVHDTQTFVASLYDTRSEATDALEGEVFGLAALLLSLSGAPAIRPRFERVTHDGCRLFHTDKLTLRLLCTYAGAGTQWLPDAEVDRSALGRGSNAAVCADPGKIRAVRRGDVALLKGEAWPGNAGRGIVHRSPPARPGTGRLLLTLDLAL